MVDKKKWIYTFNPTEFLQLPFCKVHLNVSTVHVQSLPHPLIMFRSARDSNTVGSVLFSWPWICLAKRVKNRGKATTFLPISSHLHPSKIQTCVIVLRRDRFHVWFHTHCRERRLRLQKKKKKGCAFLESRRWRQGVWRKVVIETVCVNSCNCHLLPSPHHGKDIRFSLQVATDWG